MKLDHVNLTVSNVMEVSTFLKKHFGFSDTFEDNNEGMAVLGDGRGMHLNLMKGKDAAYPKLFHIGFDMGSQAEVDAMYERLEADGVKTTAPRMPVGVHTPSTSNVPAGILLSRWSARAEHELF